MGSDIIVMSEKQRDRRFNKKYFADYEKYLRQYGLAENTIESYIWTIQNFLIQYRKINVDNLVLYKSYLKEYFKPNTVNNRIQGMNKYLKYIGMDEYRLKTVKVQQKTFLENVISNEDYVFLKKKLKKDGYTTWYYLVWFMAATGARGSEIIKLKVEHINAGYMDIYSKANKYRRIYIPTKLKKSALKWLEEEHMTTGPIFLSKNQTPLSLKTIETRFKIFAKQYGIDEDVMYPHSFRHLYGKNFINKFNDLVLLSDLLGHSSLEVTRIYLRRSAQEQAAIVNKVVTW